jgi:hypothetical protein
MESQSTKLFWVPLPVLRHTNGVPMDLYSQIITINYYFFLSQYVSQKDKILQYPADLSTTHLNSAAQRYFDQFN